MNDKEVFATTIGNSIGEVTSTFLAIVLVLKNQPNFNNEQFEKDIEDLLGREGCSDYARMVFSVLLDKEN